MSSLLRTKAWALFALLTMPLVFQILMITDTVLAFASDAGPEQDQMVLDSMIFLALLIVSAIISMIILECWFYALGTRLYTKLPADHQLKIGRFQFAFFFPIVYIVGVLCFIWFVLNTEPMFFFMIIPLHFVAMACMFYVIYFIAKSLKTVELQRPVKFGDYAGEFFLFWFYFIGVWIIQPRINKIFAQEERSEYGGPVDRYMK